MRQSISVKRNFGVSIFSVGSGRFNSRLSKLAVHALILTILLALTASATSGLLAFAQTPIPVSGAFVSADSTSGVGGSGSATSNAQGFYNITTFLDSGNYTVQASATGYIDASVQNVRVNVGQETSNVNVLLPVSGAISGRVTDAVSGAPVPSVIVGAESVVGSVTYGGVGFTDSAGNYMINTNLASGVYNVTVDFGAGYISKNVTGVSVTAGATTSNVNIQLSRSATISGTVTDSVSSAVLSGIPIYAVAASGNIVSFGTTNSTGKYTLNTDIATGTYNVTTLFPTGHLDRTVSGLAVVAGNTYTVNLALDRSGVISVRVTSTLSGAPISGATVTATSGGSFGFATTNSTGYYRISDGLTTGSYIVFASYGGGFATVPAVSVTQGQETANVNMQLTLAPSGVISGTITNSSGAPLVSALVEANGASGSGSDLTDSNGNYVIDTGLGTGTYNVTASKTGYNSVSQTGIAVTLNVVTTVNLQLTARASGRISGFVQSFSTPIPEFPAEFMLVALIAVSAVVLLRKMKSLPFSRSKPI